MSTATLTAPTAPAVPAVPVPSKDMANTSLVRDFKASLLPVIEAERALWLVMLGLMREDSLSVRGGQATIDTVNAESGALPTIVRSQVQYFLNAGDVHDTVKGAKEASLSALLNTTIQGIRKLGKKRFVELVAVTSDFKSLSKTVEKAPAKVTADSEEGALTAKEIKEMLSTADGVLLLALTSLRALEGDSAFIKDIATANAVSKIIAVGIANSNHASIRGKAKS